MNVRIPAAQAAAATSSAPAAATARRAAEELALAMVQAEDAVARPPRDDCVARRRRSPDRSSSVPQGLRPDDDPRGAASTRHGAHRRRSPRPASSQTDRPSPAIARTIAP